jgi:hypothetical protein
MQTPNQQNGSQTTDKSVETDIETNLHKLKRAGDLFRQTKNDSAEMTAANDLGTLLDRVSVVTTQEIENLVGELRLLCEKLETDRQRIQGDVAKYTELSNAVRRLYFPYMQRSAVDLLLLSRPWLPVIHLSRFY